MECFRAINLVKNKHARHMSRMTPALFDCVTRQLISLLNRRPAKCLNLYITIVNSGN